jgi:hypothetical protein
MQNITNAYDENQHDLNKKLQDMDIEIEALQQSVSQLETEKTELLAKLETSPAPAPAPVPVPEKVPAPVKKNVPVDFMTLLGFNNGK